jgi:hypothetical protein
VSAHKFQNIYVCINLCFKSRILLADDSSHGPKHVTFIGDINRSILCLTVIDKPEMIISKMKVRFTL